MALILVCAVLFGFASAAQAAALLSDPQGGVLAVAHRGETTANEPNTLDAVLAAADAGAHFVSVEATQTADEQFVLLTAAQKAQVNEAQTLSEMQTALYGTRSAEKIYPLAEVCAELSGRAGLILDFDWNERAALAGYLHENELTDHVLLRSKVPVRDALAFYEESGVRVLGVYGGNVVMNANAYLKRASKAGLPLVQYQSKNYFCVSFQVFTTKRFSARGNCRAMVNMTQPDLCGQRDDSVTGWDDMISRGFSVIETGNIKGLCAYLAARDDSLASLQSALDSAKAQPLDTLSSGSARALEAAIAAGEGAARPNASLSARQSALSALQNAMTARTPKGETETKKGTLQITTGKVLTVLVFAVLVLAAEIYVYRKKEHSKGEEDYAKKRES